MKSPTLKEKIHEIIFEAETPAGKIFDVVLILAILASVVVVMLDSVAEVREHFGLALLILEWVFTILFTIEYILRLYSVGRPWVYARSFFGIVDLLSILPTFLSLFLPGSQYLIVIRTLRTIRIWRILKLSQFLIEMTTLRLALQASVRKIVVFLVTILCLVIILGSAMYMIEGEDNGFTSIPIGIYWAIVTLTTVGYGDISPQTGLGQFLASMVMIMGYAIIAVPTGIVSVELAQAQKKSITSRSCNACSREGHDANARFCKFCGELL